MNAGTRFYQTLTAIGNLAHYGGFIFAFCTATTVSPIKQCLKPSNRIRIYLPVVPPEVTVFSFPGYKDIRIRKDNHRIYTHHASRITAGIGIGISRLFFYRPFRQYGLFPNKMVLNGPSLSTCK